MKMLIFPLVLLGLVLLPGWPLLFRRWKHVYFLWIASTLFIVSLGAWSMVYFKLERNYARLAEAQAVEATRAALAEGADPQELADALEKLEAGDEFEAVTVRSRYRLWYEAVKEAAR